MSVYNTFSLPLLLPLKIRFTGIIFGEYDALIIYRKKDNSFTDKGLFLSLEKSIA